MNVKLDSTLARFRRMLDPFNSRGFHKENEIAVTCESFDGSAIRLKNQVFCSDKIRLCLADYSQTCLFLVSARPNFLWLDIFGRESRKEARSENVKFDALATAKSDLVKFNADFVQGTCDVTLEKRLLIYYVER